MDLMSLGQVIAAAREARGLLSGMVRELVQPGAIEGVRRAGIPGESVFVRAVVGRALQAGEGWTDRGILAELKGKVSAIDPEDPDRLPRFGCVARLFERHLGATSDGFVYVRDRRAAGEVVTALTELPGRRPILLPQDRPYVMLAWALDLETAGVLTPDASQGLADGAGMVHAIPQAWVDGWRAEIALLERPPAPRSPVPLDGAHYDGLGAYFASLTAQAVVGAPEVFWG